MNREQALVFILRIIGVTSLLAVIFVFVPYAWMNDIHQGLGLGVLPADPIVGYLARSVSAFYALIGALLVVLSFEVLKYRSIVKFTGVAFFLFGSSLVFIDWSEGLPYFWKIWEGPFVSLVGLVIFWLSRGLSDSRPS